MVVEETGETSSGEEDSHADVAEGGIIEEPVEETTVEETSEESDGVTGAEVVEDPAAESATESAGTEGEAVATESTETTSGDEETLPVADEEVLETVSGEDTTEEVEEALPESETTTTATEETPDAEEVAIALEEELEVDGNILTQHNLVVPRYERVIASAQKYVEEAKKALATSQEKFAAGEFKASYAYAKFSRKLAQQALRGHFLVMPGPREPRMAGDFRTGERMKKTELTPEQLRKKMQYQPASTEPSTGMMGGKEMMEPGVREIKVIAHKFSFDPGTIEVKRGDKVILHVMSTDVVHGLRIKEYGIDEVLPVNQPVTIEFIADQPGTFTLDCSVQCGSGHSGMEGKLIVR
jgi:cytochrome c oxidase subunit 2